MFLEDTINLDDATKIGFVASGGDIKSVANVLGILAALAERGVIVASMPKDYREDDKKYIEMMIGSSGGAVACAMAANGLTLDQALGMHEDRSFVSYLLSKGSVKRWFGVRHISTDDSVQAFSYADLFGRLNVHPSSPIHYMKSVVKAVGKLRKPKFLSDTLRTIGGGFLPGAGIFKLDGLEAYLNDALRITDFKELEEKTGLSLNIITSLLDKPRKLVLGPHHDDIDMLNIADQVLDMEEDLYIGGVSIPKAVIASCAIPLLFAPVKLGKSDNSYCFDGEIKSILSVKNAVQMGSDLIFCTHIYGPRVRENGDSLAKHGVTEVALQALYSVFNRKIDRFRGRLKEEREVLKMLSSDKLLEYFPDSSPEQRQRLYDDVKGLFEMDPNIKGIYFPPVSGMFDLGHMNLFAGAADRTMLLSYVNASRILDKHDIPKHSDYSGSSIFEEHGTARFLDFMKEYQPEAEMLVKRDEARRYKP